MGQCSSLPSPKGLASPSHLDPSSPLDSSSHLPSRGNYVWLRSEPLTSLYDVDKTIGLGSMGEVSVVTKKKDGNLSLRSISNENLKVLSSKAAGSPTSVPPPRPCSVARRPRRVSTRARRCRRRT